MNIFMAAMHSNGYKGTAMFSKFNEYEQSIIMTMPHLLESYHYVYKESKVQQIRESGDKVFLDSGAFSAHTMGVSIDLPTYCKYIQTNDDILRYDDGIMMASVLDGIGDPQKTYENQCHMESLGVRPLPCFHFGEDERYLEYYIANYPYITLGGLVPVSNQAAQAWLDRIWEHYLTDGSGRPKLKVHGFGLTSENLMQRYPWHSVDSSSWIQYAAFGFIFTPDHASISISSKAPSRHNAGRHVSNFQPQEQDYIYGMLKKQGFDPERLAECYEGRAAYNLWSFRQLNDIINSRKTNEFHNVVQELF